MFELVYIGEDAYAFLEDHRKEPGKKRLTISCHGGHNGIPQIDGIDMSAADLKQRIMHWIPLATTIRRIRTIRLVSCYSATLDPQTYINRISSNERDYTFWGSAFGAQLSRQFPDALIKSYVGPATATCPTDVMWEKFQEKGHQEVQMRLAINFSIDKTLELDFDYEAPFRCITFLNGVAVKQSQQIARHGQQEYLKL